jgi:hypothetical protein
MQRTLLVDVFDYDPVLQHEFMVSVLLSIVICWWMCDLLQHGFMLSVCFLPLRCVSYGRLFLARAWPSFNSLYACMKGRVSISLSTAQFPLNGWFPLGDRGIPGKAPAFSGPCFSSVTYTPHHPNNNRRGGARRDLLDHLHANVGCRRHAQRAASEHS